MVLSVVTDVTTLAASHQLGRTNDAMITSLQRLSSGYRLNRAADDAAGLGISEGLRSQIRGMTVAVRNAQDGISVLQIADGALGDIDDLLHRMRDLTVQGANQGALNPQATAMIQKEIDQLKRQLDEVASTTNFDGTKLLDGSYSRLFQVGANVGETLAVAIGGPGHGMSTKDLGLSAVDVTAEVNNPHTVQPALSADESPPSGSQGILRFTGDYTDPGYEAAFKALNGTVTYDGKTFDLGSVDYTDAVTDQEYLDHLNAAAVSALGLSFTPFGGSATDLGFFGQAPGAGSTHADAVALTPTYTPKSGTDGALVSIDQAIDRVTSLRAELGATSNRFERTVDRLNGSIQDTTASESRIRDTDMAGEMVTFSRQQILMQTGSAMLAQGQHTGQLLLKLLG